MEAQPASLSARRGPSPLVVPIALIAIATVIGWVIATRPDLYRPLFAVGMITVLGLCALPWPRGTILGILLFLPFLGLVRRLLIGPSGWPEADPLLLIGPALALVLFARAYLLESRPLAPDLLSKLVLALLALAVLGVFNPLGEGVEAGAAALIFTAVPLLWFYVGRALPERRTIAHLQYATAFLAAAIALYGVVQTEIGFPGWDRDWIEVGGYIALGVGDQVRGFGTLASASEYAFYIGVGTALAAAALLHRRTWPLLLLPPLGVGLFLSSVRTVVLTGVLSLVAMAALRSGRPRLALPVILGATVLAYTALAPALATVASESGNALVSHQLEGISRPFDEDSSTATAHITLAAEGFRESLRNPLGQGTAATTLAAEGEGISQGMGTELDLSNTFVSLGLPGGLLYIAILGITLGVTIHRYLGTRDPVVLGVLGAAVVTLGFWLNGAHYAVAPLLWVMLGWATRPSDTGEERSTSAG